MAGRGDIGHDAPSRSTCTTLAHDPALVRAAAPGQLPGRGPWRRPPAAAVRPRAAPPARRAAGRAAARARRRADGRRAAAAGGPERVGIAERGPADGRARPTRAAPRAGPVLAARLAHAGAGARGGAVRRGRAARVPPAAMVARAAAAGQLRDVPPARGARGERDAHRTAAARRLLRRAEHALWHRFQRRRRRDVHAHVEVSLGALVRARRALLAVAAKAGSSGSSRSRRARCARSACG